MTEQTQTDGPLINLTAQEEAPQEAPMAVHEPDPGGGTGAKRGRPCI
jgi:hypothetical protein